MNEVKMKEIEEIAGIVDNALKSKYEWTDEKALEVADELMNKLGYHKTVWHKVSEGDLPTDEKDVYVYLGDNDYTRGYYNKSRKCFFNSEFDLQDRKLSVVAWTDLPTFLPTA